MIPSLYEPFKHWAATGSVYLISDPHFDDPDTFLMRSDWLNPNIYIDCLNATVHKNDTLICLGDCGNLKRFDQIKCKNRVLIKGNHDDKGNSYYAPYFNEIYSGALFIAPQILLSHEPIYGLQFCLNIHGHVHNGTYDYTDELGGRHLNIAADVIDYQAVSLGELIKAGAVAGLPTIHRLTIDNAIQKADIRNKETDIEWKQIHGVITPGGDPAWCCPVCGKGYHVYGVENLEEPKYECPNCGIKLKYSWS